MRICCWELTKLIRKYGQWDAQDYSQHVCCNEMYDCKKKSSITCSKKKSWKGKEENLFIMCVWITCSYFKEKPIISWINTTQTRIFYFTAASRLSFLSNLIPHALLEFIIFTCQTFSLTWNYLFSYFLYTSSGMHAQTYLLISFWGFGNFES